MVVGQAQLAPDTRAISKRDNKNNEQKKKILLESVYWGLGHLIAFLASVLLRDGTWRYTRRTSSGTELDRDSIVYSIAVALKIINDTI